MSVGSAATFGRIAGLVLLLGRPALAQSGAGAGRPLVRLAVEGCGAERGEEIRRIVRVELHANLVEDDAPRENTTRVRVLCADGRAELAVDDPVTGKSLARAVDIDAAAPNSRARLVALAVAELVSASWTEIDTNPRPALRPAGPPPSPEAVIAARDEARTHMLGPPERSFRLLGIIGARAILGEAWLLGAGLRAAYGGGPHILGYHLDVSLEHGTEPVALGDVAIDTASIAASLLVHRELSQALNGHLGVGARAGYAWLSARASDPKAVLAGAVTGSWAGPLVSMGLVLRLPRALRAEVTAEGGYALLPLAGHVYGASDVGVQGGWLGGAIGFGVAP